MEEIADALMSRTNAGSPLCQGAFVNHNHNGLILRFFPVNVPRGYLSRLGCVQTQSAL